MSPETHAKISGENAPGWKGGISTENEKQRHSQKYKDWRTAVFQRDNHTCTECGVRGGELHADHIVPFFYSKEMRFEIHNGRTLCVGCHRKTVTYGTRGIALYKQLGLL